MIDDTKRNYTYLPERNNFKIDKFTNILNLDKTSIFTTSTYEVLRIETIIEKVYKGGSNVSLVI